LAKSSLAFRTISEVSNYLNLPQHVLRFWETKFTQICPIKRAGGRRYYRPEDVELLRQIKGLLHDEGYTIKGARKALNDGFDTTFKSGGVSPITNRSHDKEDYDNSKTELRAILSELKAIHDELMETS